MPTARHSTPATTAASQAFSGSGAVPAISALRGPISERIARSALTSATFTSRPIEYISRCRCAAAIASGSVSSEDLLRGRPQHPHVGLHVPLAVEQRRVLPVPDLQRLDVVGQLPLQILRPVRPAHEQHPAPGPLEQPAFLPQLPVLRIQLNGNDIGSFIPTNSRKRPTWGRG